VGQTARARRRRLAGPAAESGPFRPYHFEVGDGPADSTDDGAVCGLSAQLQAEGIFGEQQRVEPTGDISHELETVVWWTVARSRSRPGAAGAVVALGQGSGQLVAKMVLGKNRKLLQPGEPRRDGK